MNSFRLILPTVLLLILLGTTVSCLGQQKQIDSLEKELKGTIADTTRVASMMRLAINYESVDTGKAATIYRDAIRLAKDKNLTYLASRNYHNYAILEYTIGFYEYADQLLDSAIYYLKKSNRPDMDYRLGAVYNEKGNVSKTLENREASLEYYLEAVRLFEKANRPSNVLNTYLNLASFFKEQQETDKQYYYASKAVEKSKLTKQPQDIFKAYTFLTHALIQKQQYDSASQTIDTARKYYDDSYPQEVRVSFHMLAGLNNMNLGKYEEARKEFEKSYEISVVNKALFTEIQSRLQLAKVLMLQRRYKEAEPILLKAFDDTKKFDRPSLTVIALEYMVNFYEEQGDYKKALGYNKEFKIVSDSIASVENKNYSSKLEAKYETQRKNEQIKNLETETKLQQLRIKEKNRLNYIFIGATIALATISLLGFRTYRQKQKLQQQRITELETEKKLAATEAVLRGEEKERTRLAKDLHDGLGGMLSGIKYSLNTMKGNLIMTPENAQAFERSMDMLDSSIREMRRVAHNMMPEALVKFGLDTALKDFCNDISTSGVLKVTYLSVGFGDQKFSQTIAITVYRIVQELINNSIKHAKAQSAIVQVSANADQVSVTVEDDGVGFDTSILNREKGIGWSNIKHRIEFLNGKLDINSKQGQGTSVLIELPV